MSMKLAKVLPAAAILGAAVLMTGAAQATPVNYKQGSATVYGFTGQTDDITKQTSWNLNPYGLANGTADLAPYIGAFPGISFAPAAVDFTTATAASFDWTALGIGSFTANSVKFAGETITGNQVTVSYDVYGHFLIGSDFLNAGHTISADETWSLTQTGGVGNAVSISGTFNAPSTLTVPEPATLGLLGLGLVAAAGAMRRRKKDI